MTLAWPSFSCLVAAAAMLFSMPPTTAAFSLASPTNLYANRLGSMLCPAANSNDPPIYYSDFDDNIWGNNNKDNEDENSSGKDLAKEFSTVVKQRQEEKQQVERQKREANSKPFSKRQEITRTDLFGEIRAASEGEEDASQEGAPPKERSAGFFTGQGQTVYSFPENERGIPSSTSPVRADMMQSEFSLLGSPERALVVQMVVTFALLSFCVAVGLTGGIKTGGDVGMDPITEWNMWNDAAMELREGLSGDAAAVEQSAPEQTSVWL